MLLLRRSGLIGFVLVSTRARCVFNCGLRSLVCNTLFPSFVAFPYPLLYIIAFPLEATPYTPPLPRMTAGDCCDVLVMDTDDRQTTLMSGRGVDAIRASLYRHPPPASSPPWPCQLLSRQAIISSMGSLIPPHNTTTTANGTARLALFSLPMRTG